MRIKRDDMVYVISGRDKGKIGKVIRVFPAERMVLVERVNMVTRHMKKTREVVEEGIVKKEAPLHVSKVMLLDQKTNRPTRVRIEEKDGAKVRVAVKSGTVFD